MATHYTLDIVNFWKNTAVYFFVEPPAVDPATSLYTNVWFQSPVTMMSGLSVRVLLRPYSCKFNHLTARSFKYGTEL
jgi:hypothetical protein